MAAAAGQDRPSYLKSLKPLSTRRRGKSVAARKRREHGDHDLPRAAAAAATRTRPHPSAPAQQLGFDSRSARRAAKPSPPCSAALRKPPPGSAAIYSGPPPLLLSRAGPAAGGGPAAADQLVVPGALTTASCFLRLLSHSSMCPAMLPNPPSTRNRPCGAHATVFREPVPKSNTAWHCHPPPPPSPVTPAAR